MAQVVVFGTGALAEVMDFYLTNDSPHDVVAFTTTDAAPGSRFRGRPVVPFRDLVSTHPPGRHAMFVAIGYRERNRVRARFYDEAKALGYELITYVSSRAHRWEGAQIGDNCVVFEGSIIEPFVAIGDDVILWGGVHVAHHSSIGDHCFLAPRATLAGFVSVGEAAFVGVNACVRDGVALGEECIVAAGATVLRDVAPREVFRGVDGASDYADD